MIMLEIIITLYIKRYILCKTAFKHALHKVWIYNVTS